MELRNRDFEKLFFNFRRTATFILTGFLYRFCWLKPSIFVKNCWMVARASQTIFLNSKEFIAILNDSDKFVGVVLRVPTPYLSGNRAWDCPYNNYANDARIAIFRAGVPPTPQNFKFF